MLKLGHADRRRFLQLGVLGLGNVSFATSLAALEPGYKKPTVKSCILLYMDGGPSHIDMWDLKPNAPREIRGPYRPIATSVPGLQIGELLPEVASRMHLTTLIRSINHQEQVHDPAVYQMLTGYKHLSSGGGLEVKDSDFPHMGSALVHCDRTPAVMPKFIQLPTSMKMQSRVLPGQNGGFLGRAVDPYAIEMDSEGEFQKPDFGLLPEIDRMRLAERRGLLRKVDRGVAGLGRRQGIVDLESYRRQVFNILEAPSIRAAFDLEREPDRLRDRYGRHRHGQSVLLARRLAEAGARLITVYWGKDYQDWNDGKGEQLANNPWDTHRNHFPIIEKRLIPRADQTLSALLDDLRDRDMLDETLVVWMGDFGRTPKISSRWASRDHWPGAFSVLMAGGDIPRGAVLGSTDRNAAEVVDDPISPADLTATIFDALGVDPRTLLQNPMGRTFPISTGRPILRGLG